MRCRHNCFEGHQSDHTFALPGSNECSLGVVITTPCLSVNKGAFHPGITHSSRGGSPGVTHSFPLFLIYSRAGRCSQGASPDSRSFILTSFLSSSGLYQVPYWEQWSTRQPGSWHDAEPECFQVTGTPLGELESMPSAIPKAGDICLPPKMTNFSRAVVYFSCWASQWDDDFLVHKSMLGKTFSFRNKF